ncbi:hypothetical protein [Sporolactobacillus vineae]|uniref:hypothetical protein n=1 Tax=Sporolactobacillus vineae TaxID=444463 RepID=UPI0002891642|nr:hypothetical protein [Sporolactobacillus vineae]
MRHRIAVRAKKYLLLIVAVPLILGLLGWFVPAGKAPSSYKATTTIALGNYDDPDYNYRSRVSVYLMSPEFYQAHMPDVWKAYRADLFPRLTVTQGKSPLIQVTFTGPSKKEAALGANQIASGFLAADKVQYQKHVAVVDESITRAQMTKSDAAARAESDSLIYTLKMKKLSLKPAQLMEAADPSRSSGSTVFTSKKRALLGIMLGLTLALAWLALPELVRPGEKDQEVRS